MSLRVHRISPLKCCFNNCFNSRHSWLLMPKMIASSSFLQPKSTNMNSYFVEQNFKGSLLLSMTAIKSSLLSFSRSNNKLLIPFSLSYLEFSWQNIYFFCKWYMNWKSFLLRLYSIYRQGNEKKRTQLSVLDTFLLVLHATT